MGAVDEFFRGKNPKTVVLIQDAHAIPAAQASIAALIGYFEKEYGITHVALEGAADELDAEMFRTFPDKKALKQVFKTYHDQGNLAGGVAAAVFPSQGGAATGASRTRFFGMEDWELYQDGIGHYLAAIKVQPSISEKLDAEQQGISEEKQKIYPERLLVLDRAIEKFEDNKADLLEVLKRLAAVKPPAAGSELEILFGEAEKGAAAMTSGVDGSSPREPSIDVEVRQIAKQVKQHLPQKGDGPRNRFNEKYQEYQTSKISPEVFALFLKELIVKYKLPVKASKALGEKVRRQKRMEDIQGTKLFDDFEKYAEEVKASLFENDRVREINRLSRELSLLQRFNKLELTHEDWEELKGTGKSGLPASLNGEFAAHFAFYENAIQRDHALFENLKQQLEEGGSSRALAAVAGGFHARGLTRLLKENGISYVLLMPSIKDIPEETSYRDQMLGNVPWKDYFKVVNGKISVYNAFVRSTRDRLLAGSNPTSQFTLKYWRDEILRDLASKKRLTEAGSYTKFIDEVTPQGREKSEAVKSLQEKAESFIAGLRGLYSDHRVNQQAVLQLLTSFGAQTFGGPGILAAGHEVRAGLIPSVRSDKEISAAAPEGAGVGLTLRTGERREMRGADALNQKLAGAKALVEGANVLSGRRKQEAMDRAADHLLSAMSHNPDDWQARRSYQDPVTGRTYQADAEDLIWLVEILLAYGRGGAEDRDREKMEWALIELVSHAPQVLGFLRSERKTFEKMGAFAVIYLKQMAGLRVTESEHEIGAYEHSAVPVEFSYLVRPDFVRYAAQAASALDLGADKRKAEEGFLGLLRLAGQRSGAPALPDIRTIEFLIEIGEPLFQLNPELLGLYFKYLGEYYETFGALDLHDGSLHRNPLADVQVVLNGLYDIYSDEKGNKAERAEAFLQILSFRTNVDPIQRARLLLTDLGGEGLYGVQLEKFAKALESLAGEHFVPVPRFIEIIREYTGQSLEQAEAQRLLERFKFNPRIFINKILGMVGNPVFPENDPMRRKHLFSRAMQAIYNAGLPPEKTEQKARDAVRQYLGFEINDAQARSIAELLLTPRPEPLAVYELYSTQSGQLSIWYWSRLNNAEGLSQLIETNAALVNFIYQKFKRRRVSEEALNQLWERQALAFFGRYREGEAAYPQAELTLLHPEDGSRYWTMPEPFGSLQEEFPDLTKKIVEMLGWLPEVGRQNLWWDDSLDKILFISRKDPLAAEDLLRILGTHPDQIRTILSEGVADCLAQMPPEVRKAYVAFVCVKKDGLSESEAAAQRRWLDPLLVPVLRVLENKAALDAFGARLKDDSFFRALRAHGEDALGRLDFVARNTLAASLQTTAKGSQAGYLRAIQPGSITDANVAAFQKRAAEESMDPKLKEALLKAISDHALFSSYLMTEGGLDFVLRVARRGLNLAHAYVHLMTHFHEDLTPAQLKQFEETYQDLFADPQMPESFLISLLEILSRQPQLMGQVDVELLKELHDSMGSTYEEFSSTASYRPDVLGNQGLLNRIRSLLDDPDPTLGDRTPPAYHVRDYGPRERSLVLAMASEKNRFPDRWQMIRFLMSISAAPANLDFYDRHLETLKKIHYNLLYTLSTNRKDSLEDTFDEVMLTNMAQLSDPSPAAEIIREARNVKERLLGSHVPGEAETADAAGRKVMILLQDARLRRLTAERAKILEKWFQFTRERKTVSAEIVRKGIDFIFSSDLEDALMAKLFESGMAPDLMFRDDLLGFIAQMQADFGEGIANVIYAARAERMADFHELLKQADFYENLRSNVDDLYGRDGRSRFARAASARAFPLFSQNRENFRRLSDVLRSWLGEDELRLHLDAGNFVALKQLMDFAERLLASEPRVREKLSAHLDALPAGMSRFHYLVEIASFQPHVLDLLISLEASGMETWLAGLHEVKEMSVLYGQLAGQLSNGPLAACGSEEDVRLLLASAIEPLVGAVRASPDAVSAVQAVGRLCSYLDVPVPDGIHGAVSAAEAAERLRAQILLPLSQTENVETAAGQAKNVLIHLEKNLAKKSQRMLKIFSKLSDSYRRLLDFMTSSTLKELTSVEDIEKYVREQFRPFLGGVRSAPNIEKARESARDLLKRLGVNPPEEMAAAATADELAAFLDRWLPSLWFRDRQDRGRAEQIARVLLFERFDKAMAFYARRTDARLVEALMKKILESGSLTYVKEIELFTAHAETNGDVLAGSDIREFLKTAVEAGKKKFPRYIHLLRVAGDLGQTRAAILPISNLKAEQKSLGEAMRLMFRQKDAVMEELSKELLLAAASLEYRPPAMEAMSQEGFQAQRFDTEAAMETFLAEIPKHRASKLKEFLAEMEVEPDRFTTFEGVIDFARKNYAGHVQRFEQARQAARQFTRGSPEESAAASELKVLETAMTYWLRQSVDLESVHRLYRRLENLHHKARFAEQGLGAATKEDFERSALLSQKELSGLLGGMAEMDTIPGETLAMLNADTLAMRRVIVALGLYYSLATHTAGSEEDREKMRKHLSLLMRTYLLTRSQAAMRQIVLGFEKNKAEMKLLEPKGMEAKGYDLRLLTEGLSLELTVGGVSEKERQAAIRKEISARSGDLIQIAVAAGFRPEGFEAMDPAEFAALRFDNGNEATEFYRKMSGRFPDHPRVVAGRNLMAQIMALENQILQAAPNVREAKVRVVIGKDPLDEITSCDGNFGCFQPIDIHREMPPAHAMEANAFLARIYEVDDDGQNGRILANAVLALTDDGVVVHASYGDRHDVDIGGLWFKTWQALSKVSPGVILTSVSAGMEKAADFMRQNQVEAAQPVKAVKRATEWGPMYYDFGANDLQGNVTFDLPNALVLKGDYFPEVSVPEFRGAEPAAALPAEAATVSAAPAMPEAVPEGTEEVAAAQAPAELTREEKASIQKNLMSLRKQSDGEAQPVPLDIHYRPVLSALNEIILGQTIDWEALRTQLKKRSNQNEPADEEDWGILYRALREFRQGHLAPRVIPNAVEKYRRQLDQSPGQWPDLERLEEILTEMGLDMTVEPSRPERGAMTRLAMRRQGQILIDPETLEAIQGGLERGRRLLAPESQTRRVSDLKERMIGEQKPSSSEIALHGDLMMTTDPVTGEIKIKPLISESRQPLEDFGGNTLGPATRGLRFELYVRNGEVRMEIIDLVSEDSTGLMNYYFVFVHLVQYLSDQLDVPIILEAETAIFKARSQAMGMTQVKEAQSLVKAHWNETISPDFLTEGIDQEHFRYYEGSFVPRTSALVDIRSEQRAFEETIPDTGRPLEDGVVSQPMTHDEASGMDQQRVFERFKWRIEGEAARAILHRIRSHPELGVGAFTAAEIAAAQAGELFWDVPVYVTQEGKKGALLDDHANPVPLKDAEGETQMQHKKVKMLDNAEQVLPSAAAVAANKQEAFIREVIDEIRFDKIRFSMAGLLQKIIVRDDEAGEDRYVFIINRGALRKDASNVKFGPIGGAIGRLTEDMLRFLEEQLEVPREKMESVTTEVARRLGKMGKAAAAMSPEELAALERQVAEELQATGDLDLRLTLESSKAGKGDVREKSRLFLEKFFTREDREKDALREIVEELWKEQGFFTREEAVRLFGPFLAPPDFEALFGARTEMRAKAEETRAGQAAERAAMRVNPVRLSNLQAKAQGLYEKVDRELIRLMEDRGHDFIDFAADYLKQWNKTVNDSVLSRQFLLAHSPFYGWVPEASMERLFDFINRATDPSAVGFNEAVEFCDAMGRILAMRDIPAGDRSGQLENVLPGSEGTGDYLDLASGIFAATFFKNLQPGRKYVFVDISPFVTGYLEEAKSLLGAPGVEIWRQDLMAMVSENPSLGTIRMKNVWTYVPALLDSDAFWNWVEKSVAAGGQLILEVLPEDTNREKFRPIWEKFLGPLRASGWSFHAEPGQVFPPQMAMLGLISKPDLLVFTKPAARSEGRETLRAEMRVTQMNLPAEVRDVPLYYADNHAVVDESSVVKILGDMSWAGAEGIRSFLAHPSPESYANLSGDDKAVFRANMARIHGGFVEYLSGTRLPALDQFDDRTPALGLEAWAKQLYHIAQDRMDREFLTGTGKNGPMFQADQDVILGIGATPSWPLLALKTIVPSYGDRTFNIAISGIGKMMPSAAVLDNYQAYLQSTGLLDKVRALFEPESKGHLVLTDLVMTESSANSFINNFLVPIVQKITGKDRETILEKIRFVMMARYAQTDDRSYGGFFRDYPDSWFGLDLGDAMTANLDFNTWANRMVPYYRPGDEAQQRPSSEVPLVTRLFMFSLFDQFEKYRPIVEKRRTVGVLMDLLRSLVKPEQDAEKRKDVIAWFNRLRDAHEEDIGRVDFGDLPTQALSYLRENYPEQLAQSPLAEFGAVSPADLADRLMEYLGDPAKRAELRQPIAEQIAAVPYEKFAQYVDQLEAQLKAQIEQARSEQRAPAESDPQYFEALSLAVTDLASFVKHFEVRGGVVGVKTPGAAVNEIQAAQWANNFTPVVKALPKLDGVMPDQKLSGNLNKAFLAVLAGAGLTAAQIVRPSANTEMLYNQKVVPMIAGLEDTGVKSVTQNERLLPLGVQDDAAAPLSGLELGVAMLMEAAVALSVMNAGLSGEQIQLIRDVRAKEQTDKAAARTLRMEKRAEIAAINQKLAEQLKQFEGRGMDQIDLTNPRVVMAQFVRAFITSYRAEQRAAVSA
ncbi:MAG: hypothetical protein WCU74_04170 [Candidatus Omnitrophota bacterium]